MSRRPLSAHALNNVVTLCRSYPEGGWTHQIFPVENDIFLFEYFLRL